MLTLTDIQSVPYGDVLGDADLAYANEMLGQGRSREFVWNCVRGWAHEINRVSHAETEDARRFEAWSY